ncbi:MAG TPA: carbon-nitrogen hydrolase family protein [Candidatus Dormibacteraeota bacterium]|nr:carbon-nitrogen hydrolase family protein [Candidatus Dormibacteraeota bacterium]
MARTLRVAALQLRAHDRRSFEQAFRGIERSVDDAAADADLVVLPEGTVPAYVLGDSDVDDIGIDRAVARLCEIAARRAAVIVAGVATRDGSQLYNAGVVIDSDGRVAGRADKVFLWHFDRRWFAAGTQVAPIHTSIGRLGVLVCADGRMPEIARALVDGGAEMLVMPTAWVSSGRDPNALENPIADLLAPMRAYENGVPFAAADKCGVEREMVLYCGKSQILSDSGDVLAIAGEREPQCIVATVELGDPHPSRVALPEPAPRETAARSVLRVAVSAHALPGDIDDRLRILECEHVLAPGAQPQLAALDATIPVAIVDDGVMHDPAGLAAFRRAGYRLALWATRSDAWTERIARARAGEARMYVVVLDAQAGRAFVVDPDYAIVCGTFDGYRLAACAIDPAKTAQTLVAPGTDVAEGLARVHAMTMR